MNNHTETTTTTTKRADEIVVGDVLVFPPAQYSPPGSPARTCTVTSVGRRGAFVVIVGAGTSLRKRVATAVRVAVR